MLETLEGIKEKLNEIIEKKDGFTFLCTICQRLYGNKEMEKFEDYLAENFPHDIPTFNTQEDFITFRGVVFNTDEDRMNWINKQIEIETKKIK